MTPPSSLLPPPPARFALLGGTFDPPHIGHLVAAQCALHQFDLEQVVFLPAGDPWRKTGIREQGAGSSPEGQGGDSSLSPLSSSLPRRVSAASHRLEMTRLAIQDNPHFTLDPRETQRPGPTYTVDTLEQLHQEREAAARAAGGAGTPPSSLLPPPSPKGIPPSGPQSALPRREAPLPATEGGPPPSPFSLLPPPFLILGSDALADLPHWKSPERIKQLAQIIIAPKAGFDVSSSPYPVIDMPLLDISSTLIRTRIAQGKPIRYLLPPAVEAYIHAHGLYR